MKGYVYFFRHKNTKGVKIGFTTNETVNKRFDNFNTYSPSGGEILGFIKTDNANELERKIHEEYKPFRMHGEFFNIDDNIVDFLIDKYSDKTLKKIKLEFNKWISNPDNNIDLLFKLFKRVDEISIKSNLSKYEGDVLKELIEYKEINQLDKLYFSIKEVNQILDSDLSYSFIKSQLKDYKKTEKITRYINYKHISKTGKPYCV